MSAPSYEYSDDPRAYRAERDAHERRKAEAQRLLQAFVLAYEQYQPTWAQCLAGALDTLSEKPDAWLLSRVGLGTLRRLGLTVEQVIAWRGHGGRSL